MCEYKDCSNCRHECKGVFEEPCLNCKYNLSVNSNESEEYPLLWELRTDDPVSHPSHYTQGGIECIEAMEAAFGKEAVATFCHLNAFKYLWRTEHKNGVQDIDKAIWYLNKYKELKSVG